VKLGWPITLAAILVAGCMTGSTRANPGSVATTAGVPLKAGPRTRAELTSYRETSRYADVIAFLDSLRGRAELSFGSLGKSTEGRDIPFVVASRPRVSTPEEARRLGRPIVYVQGNIHAGEVDGKEALLALVRNLTSTRPGVLDSIILIAVPIYNADGNEKFGPQERNRGSQNGPAMVGERANGQGLDLNRDYIKAEAPETRGALALFNEWDPHVFVDLHTTNGSYHGYALTYAPPLNPASPLGAFTRDFVLPTLRARMQQRHGFATFDYGDFISDDTLSKGWATFDPRPRYGTNYYGLRGRISLLSEAYSHDPFPRRVASTYAFVREILSLIAQEADIVRRLTAVAANLPAQWNKPGVMTHSVPIRSSPLARPDSVEVIAEAIERLNDSSRTEPGVPRGRRRTGRFTAVRMPVYDRFRPTLFAPPPFAYLLAAGDTQAVRLLRLHGVRVDSLAATQLAVAETFVADSAIASPRQFQGHRELRVSGRWMSERRELPPGSFIVRTSQPLGSIIIYLLEPLSDDGLVTWNFYDTAFHSGGAYPVLRVTSEPRPAPRTVE
jgi:hypothetical protein